MSTTKTYSREFLMNVKMFIGDYESNGPSGCNRHGWLTAVEGQWERETGEKVSPFGLSAERVMDFAKKYSAGE